MRWLLCRLLDVPEGDVIETLLTHRRAGVVEQNVNEEGLRGYGFGSRVRFYDTDEVRVLRGALEVQAIPHSTILAELREARCRGVQSAPGL